MTSTNPLWARDDIQFPRLLCEIVANCELPELPQVAESMDLTMVELDELFDRAHIAWETVKGRHCP